MKAGRAEKHNCVLDLFTAETGERLDVFREYAQDSPVRTIEKGLILVSDGRGF
jgi:hypothetical protein